MKKKLILLLLVLSLLGCETDLDRRGRFSASFNEDSVVKVCNAVADYHLARQTWYGWTNWVKGAEYSGLVDWAEHCGSDKYYEILKKRASEKAEWKLGKDTYFADDHTVGWYYLELAREYAEKEDYSDTKYMYEDIIKVFDYILENPSDVDLEFDLTGEKKYGKYWDLSQQRWSWCDSLFMSPPVWFNLANLTGEKKYAEFANKEFWETTNFLFDSIAKKENPKAAEQKYYDLYFRDSKFFPKNALEDNDEKIFWGRGNAWVLGGFIKMLRYLPEEYKEDYLEIYRKMAREVIGLQDKIKSGRGFWHASLLDPNSYPNPESSATGFFCYGLAGGLNNGYIEKDTKLYEDAVEAVKAAWKFLVSAVHFNGKVGWVQAIGEDPKDVKFGDTEGYGAGAFLHAGAEIIQLIEKEILTNE